jgi:hypothetical protein
LAQFRPLVGVEQLCARPPSRIQRQLVANSSGWTAPGPARSHKVFKLSIKDRPELNIKLMSSANRSSSSQTGARFASPGFG